MFMVLHVYRTSGTMDEPPDRLVARALEHQNAARSTPSTPSSAFSISTDPFHDKYCRVAKTVKTKVVAAIQSRAKEARHKPRSEREATQVFSAQAPNKVTTAVFTTICAPGPSGDNHRLDPLPGGVPLVDHVAAFVSRSPDWHEVSPFIESLRDSRLPSTEDANNWKELTIGESSVKKWEDVNTFLEEKAKQDLNTLYPLWAADTESTSVKITWPVYHRTSNWESLLIHIAKEADAGKKEVEFIVAPDGCSACSIPARFFFGSVDWHVHIRLPFENYSKNGEDRVVLRLDTTLLPQVKKLFLALGPMVGAGITEDYVEWSAMLHAIWNTRFFEDMARPIELEHLARAARVNTVNSSIFHFNWWCMGTVLPKNFSSLGDKKWAQPLKNIPLSLKQYLAGDVVQAVKIAALFILIWIIQSFPDTTVIQDAMKTSVTGFVKWVHQAVLRKLFTGIRKICTDSNGHWLKVKPQPTWVEQPTVRAIIERLDPPSLGEHPLIWKTPDWPSIPCGGPRSLLQARGAIVDRLSALSKLDPDRWQAAHEHKLLLWRFGVNSQTDTAITAPVRSHGMILHQNFESHLDPDPDKWTREQFKASSSTRERSDRVLILEFVRLNPDKASAVLKMMEQQKSKFKHLVGDSRTMKIVVDVRNMLKYLNMEVKRPADWKDPYKVKEHFEAAAAKQIKHAEARLKILMSKEEGLQKAIAATKRTLECASKTAEEPEKRARMSEEMETDQSTNRTVKWIKPEEPSPRNVRYRDEKEEAEVREQQFIAPPPATPAKITKSYAEVVKAQHRAPTPAPAATGPFDVTPAVASIIQKALNSDIGEIINKTGSVRIDGHDIRSTVGTRWLNDAVISAYIQLVADRSKADNNPKVCALNTVFYSMFGSLGYDSVRQFTKKLDIFKYDLVMFPIHLGNHWALVVVDTFQLTATYYDSKIGPGTTDAPAHIIVKFLEKEYKEKKGQEMGFNFTVQWDKTAPQQTNGYDCGVYVCIFAEQLARDETLSVNPDDVPAFRKQMVWEIVNNRLHI